jgi:hypothetical protein
VRKIDNVRNENAINPSCVETKIEVTEWYWMSVNSRDQTSQDQEG